MLKNKRKTSLSSLRALGLPLRAVDTNIQDDEDEEAATEPLTPRRHSDDATPSHGREAQRCLPSVTYPRLFQGGGSHQQQRMGSQATPLQRLTSHHPLKPPSYPRGHPHVFHTQDVENSRQRVGSVPVKLPTENDKASSSKAPSANPHAVCTHQNGSMQQPDSLSRPRHVVAGDLVTPDQGAMTGGNAHALMVPQGYHSSEIQPPPVEHSVARQQPMDAQTTRHQQPVVAKLNLSPELEADVVAIDDCKYKKLKLIGRGGSSKVFKVAGEDYQTYALKEVYLKHVDPAIISAYTNEIRLLNKLQGKPEIITLHNYSWEKSEGVLYMLLDYAEMDLNAAIAKKRIGTQLPMSTVYYYWSEMLRAVKVIHDEGVVHNDLKPENFVCCALGLRLIDFGISNRIEEEKTSFERDVRCGTINYMAPETIETYGDKDYFKVGRASDVWSLGCILYLMLYRRTPFAHFKNKLKKWQAITDPSVEIPFSELHNKAAVHAMKQCLQRNPKARPSIDELMEHPFSKYMYYPANP